MIRIIKKKIFFLFLFLIFSSCSSIPLNTLDGCSIFSEKYLWYKHAVKSYEKWDVPIYIQLAIIQKESNFNWLAKPPRKKLFKIIPYKRPSSSLGYSQAVNKTWELYKKETKNNLATRVSFRNSVDFIGWYIDKTNKLLKIPKTDIYRQYIAYHEGWGNYKNYKKNQKVIILATRVKKQANKYKIQLKKCKERLEKKKFIIY